MYKVCDIFVAIFFAERQSFLWLFCLDDTRSPRKKWDRDWVESQNNGIGNETLVNFWDFFIQARDRAKKVLSCYSFAF